MGNFLMILLNFVIMIAIVFAIMFLGRKYVFSKVRINKFIPLGTTVVLIILQVALPSIIGNALPVWATFLLTIATVTFLLWFMDILMTGGPKKKEKKIEIRPKAKPNRVKHLNNQNSKK